MRDGLIFLAQPSLAVLAAIERELGVHGLIALLGDALFPLRNLHQSFSDKHPYRPDICAAMLRAGASVSASAFSISLNRINGNAQRPKGIHWAVRGRGTPKGFTALMLDVRAALLAQGIDDTLGHTPHLTISYRAPSPLATIQITPIEWMVDELLLAKAGGRPYGYEIIGRWPLASSPYPEREHEQLSLLR